MSCLILAGIATTATGCGRKPAPARAVRIPMQSPSGAVAVVNQISCPEPTWDFGSADYALTQRLTHSFEVRNSSDLPIEIEKIRPSCGCVVPEGQPSEIPANASAEITVSVNLPNRPGQFQKSIDVVVGTSPPGHLSLWIHGTVEASAGLVAEPGVLEFGHLSEAETRVRTLRLSRANRSPVAFLRTVPQSFALSQLGPVEKEDEDAFIEIVVSLDSAKLDPGEFQSSIVVATRHERLSDITVPVRAWVRQPCGFVNCIFTKLRLGESQDVNMTNTPDRDLAVEKVQFDGDPRIAVEWLPQLANEPGSGTPKIRVLRSEVKGESRLARGHVVATVAGRANAIRIPLVAYLLD